MPDVTSLADAVRQRFAEALARRAGAHAGAARRVIDEKLARLKDAMAPPRDAEARVDVAPPARGPLGELVDHAARQKTTPVPGTAARPRDALPGELAADATTRLFFQRTWSRLSADQRLAQSRASLPDNAGPLNSHHLVHRSLVLMRALSPEYLERFVGYIDALQWLEQANEAAAEARPAPKKSMAARR